MTNRPCLLCDRLCHISDLFFWREEDRNKCLCPECYSYMLEKFVFTEVGQEKFKKFLDREFKKRRKL